MFIKESSHEESKPGSHHSSSNLGVEKTLLHINNLIETLKGNGKVAT